MLGAVHAAAATTADDKRAELERTRQALERTRQEIRALANREKSVVERVGLVDTKIALTQKLIGGLKEAQAGKKKEIDTLTATIATIERHQERLAADLKERLVTIYKRSRFLELELVLGAQSLPDIYRRIFYLRTIAQVDRARFDQYRAVQVKLESDRVELGRSFDALTALRIEREAEEDSLGAAKQEGQKTLDQIRNQKKAKEAAAEELRRAAERLANLISSFETKRGRRVTPAGEHFVERGRGKLSWPYHGPIVSGFGTQSHPVYGTKTRNNGIDIRCPTGSSVSAVAPGKVAYASRFMAYGNTVLVDHGDGYYSVYSQLDEITVGIGERVSTGQKVGTAGGVLHFEFRQNAQPVNPLNWLN